MKKYRLIIIAVIMLAGLFIHLRPGLDKWLFEIINGTHYRFLDMLMLPLTYCGDGTILFIGALCLWRIRGRKQFLQVIISLIAAGMLVYIIKRLFPSPRPAAIMPSINTLGPILRKYAFPSGHTASIFALAAFARVEFKKVMPVFWPVAVMVAVSRVYVGAHFPSDVIFSAALGCLVGWLVQKFFKKDKI